MINAFKIGANSLRTQPQSHLNFNQYFGLLRVLMKHKISCLCPFTGEKIVKRMMKRKMSCMYIQYTRTVEWIRPGEGER
jgi:hypothetical protein